MEENIKYNIQPQAGVLGAFSRLNYKPWYAIAEFVDNSTQSFYSNENELHEYGIDDVEIKIDYDSETNVLTIVDTAFGMEIEDFLRAIKVDSPPDVKIGRNEFGMGLKTAASWFGNVWSVESTQFGSPNRYSTVIDIDELRANGINDIIVKKTPADEFDHGTKIVISSITKRIDAPRTKSKIINLLESMYRRDLASGKVRIIYDGVTELQFEEYECLKFRNKIWKKDINFDCEFEGKSYSVKGFVGILAAGGGFARAGFSLFRRGRVVIGGEDQNYKPEAIFGQIQSPISHKLYGEIYLEDFPVNQAKDGFAWDDGLEIAFVDRLKVEIQDYIDIAKISVKDREKEESLSAEMSDTIKSSVQEQINKAFIATDDLLIHQSSPTETSEKSEVDLYAEYQSQQNSAPEKVSDEARTYVVPINPHTSYAITVRWAIGDNTSWITVTPSIDGNSADVKLNINHPFFKPFSEKQEFKVVLEKFAIAFVLSEIRSKQMSDSNGYIKASTFRNFINSYLKELSTD